MTEVMDVRAVQHGAWWTVSVPSMPGLIAQVSSLQANALGAALAASSPTADVADIAVRRVERVTGAAGATVEGRLRDGGTPSWSQQAVRATRLDPRRVARLLAH
jgi:hypothetical protein